MIRLLKYAMSGLAGFFAGKRSARGPSTREQPRLPAPDRKSELKTFLKRLAMLVPVLAVCGFLVAASGIVPIKASSGHWPITVWFLNFSKSRSVALHSTGIQAPTLDDPVLVLKGAGHYENGCLPCHGGPALEHPRIAQQMTPQPPHLADRIEKWKPAELFYIVKHGIKLTGMPAWPTQSRDDEVWAVVAFLLRFPDMTAEEYERLVQGPARPAEEPPTADSTSAISAPVEGLVHPEGQAPATVSDRCGRCHGVQGSGREVGAFPRLAGQRPHYLFGTLMAYKEGERHSGIMQPIAAGLSEDEMREIAWYYSRLDARPVSAAEGDAAAVERGRRIAHEGIPRKRVPSCADCHGPGTFPRNPFYPLLAGQYAEYIALQLDLFKDEKRGGSVYARLMHPTADDLTAEQIRDVALYYASLAADADTSARQPQ